MTPKQKTLYWREWNHCRTHLIQQYGRTPAEADHERHDLHIKALGYDISHHSLTNSEFDKILARFRAVSRPGDLTTQLRQIDQPLTRIETKCRTLWETLNLSEPYVDAIARRICKKPLNTLKEADYRKLLAALTYHQKRQQQKTYAALQTADIPF